MQSHSTSASRPTATRAASCCCCSRCFYQSYYIIRMCSSVIRVSCVSQDQFYLFCFNCGLVNENHIPQRQSPLAATFALLRHTYTSCPTTYDKPHQVGNKVFGKMDPRKTSWLPKDGMMNSGVCCQELARTSSSCTSLDGMKSRHGYARRP